MTAKQEEPTIKIGRDAILAGGKIGGKYLNEIGITDLADLNEAQWEQFLTRCFVNTFFAANTNVDYVPF